MENEYFVFQEMEDLSISQTMKQYLPVGVFNLDFPTGLKFDIDEEDHTRFVKPVSDEELKILVDNQENVNIKSNTKWAINLGDRCIADFLDDYLGALDGAGSFYRRPLTALPGRLIWFSNQKVGVSKLKSFMKSICEKGGLIGHYTNHSGKRLCATQLYN
ncbi:unnamed protein product [Mytilus coruscus]|uniref:DUF3504 domain-containing protein n=1 Tax=Mytilus coruscus TaxID=42192 RepID=A0A6J8DXI2_MYTCO|nr:unnamed protein product [Mytilus coruscus]